MSSNTAYARIVRKIGAASVVDVAVRMGVKNYLEPVPSVVLGTQGVNTLEMASAFGTLATGGIYNEPIAILKVVDSAGNVIFEAAPSGRQAISPQVAYAATNVLKGVVNSYAGTGTLAYLPNQPCAGKTGTTEDFHDSWFVGYTPQLSVAVWIGSHEERRIQDNVGGSNCCPVWKAFMLEALLKYPYADFPTSTNPPYNPKADFLTAEEKKEKEEKEKEEEEKRLKEEEEKRLKEEEERRQKEEEDKKKQQEEEEGEEPGDGDGGEEPVVGP